MKLDVSCKVFCHLMCNLCLLATARGLCTMQNELSRIETPGYKSYLVHTNKCIEITGSVLKPEVMVGYDDYGGFRKHYADDCCCAVTNYSEEEVLLERPEGTGHAIARYKRIEACGCVSCGKQI